MDFGLLKMKCTQYGLYGQVAFKNVRAISFSKSGRVGKEHGLHLGSEGGVPRAGPVPWAYVI